MKSPCCPIKTSALAFVEFVVTEEAGCYLNCPHSTAAATVPTDSDVTLVRAPKPLKVHIPVPEPYGLDLDAPVPET